MNRPDGAPLPSSSVWSRWFRSPSTQAPGAFKGDCTVLISRRQEQSGRGRASGTTSNGRTTRRGSRPTRAFAWDPPRPALSRRAWRGSNAAQQLRLAAGGGHLRLLLDTHDWYILDTRQGEGDIPAWTAFNPKIKIRKEESGLTRHSQSSNIKLSHGNSEDTKAHCALLVRDESTRTILRAHFVGCGAPDVVPLGL